MGAIRLLFAVVAYGIFFAAFLYMIGFVGNLYVPRSIDIGPAAEPMTAALIDIGLIALFGLQHSVMARPGFKAALTRAWPAAIERSLYVLVSTALLVLLFWLWRPLPELLWSAQAEWLRMLLWALFFAGWGIVLLSTFLLNHFELFGLQQAWTGFRGTQMPAGRFRQPLFYRLVRHPLYTGFLIAFWAIPDMSQGHLLFAICMTVYVVIAIRYEERDLTAHLGVEYSEYQVRVGMLIPGIGKAKSADG